MTVALVTLCAILLYLWGERNRKRAADKDKENERLTRAVAEMLTDQSVVDTMRTLNGHHLGDLREWAGK